MLGITEIYAYFVQQTTVTYETEVPTLEEMMRRRADVLGKKLPHLVLEVDGVIVGFGYANWFKPRAAYRFSAENSIYLREGFAGKGYGRLLLAELLTQLERAGIRKVMAVIGDGSNVASIKLHEKQGFTHVGVVEAYGWKFGQWLDLVLMQRSLGLGASQPPRELV